MGDTRFLDFGSGIQSTLIGNDFVRISADAGEMVFDALVDGSQTTSEKDRIFAGIGEALTYLAVTVGLTQAAIAVRQGTYTEAANWTPPATFRLFGMRGLGKTSQGGWDSDDINWAWNGFRPTVTADAHLDTMRVAPGTVGAAGITPVFSTLTTHDCFFNMSSMPTSASLTFCEFFYGSATQWDFVETAGTYRWCLNDAIFVGCDAVIRGVLSASITLNLADRTLIWKGGRLSATAGSGSPTHTIQLPPSFDVDFINSDDWLNSGASSCIRSFSVPAAAWGSINCHGTRTGSDSWRVANGGANFTRLSLRGMFNSIDISGSHGPIVIDAFNEATWTINGPAVISSACGFGSRYIFGGTISGNIAASTLTGSSGAFVAFVNGDNCEVNLAVDGTAGTGTFKACSFDAASSNNVVVLAGRTTFPAVYTDAGTNNRVLPEGTVPFTTDGHVIEDEGVGLTQRANLNFVGAGVTVTDNTPDTDVTIPGVGTPTSGWGSLTNVTTDRAYDADSTTVNELADVLGSLVADLISQGILSA